MTKNKHLLALLVAFSVGNVLACAALIVGEKGNARDIEALTSTLRETRQECTRAQTELRDLMAKNGDQVQETRGDLARLGKKQDELEARLRSAQGELLQLRDFVAGLQQKKWLMAAPKEQPPWVPDLGRLQERLKKIEDQLAKPGAQSGDVLPKKD